MKKRIYPKKRVTLAALLIRAVCIVVILTLTFAFAYRRYVRYSFDRQGKERINENVLAMQQYINRVQAETEEQFHLQDISYRMGLYMYYDFMLYNPFDFDNQDYIAIVPEYDPDCYVVAALVDSDNNIVASNRQILVTHIQFAKGNDSDKGWYACDDEALGLPEVDQLYADYRELLQYKSTYHHSLEMQLESAYVNKETHSFIPHTGYMKIMLHHNDDGSLVETSEWTDADVREINITVDLPGYELMEMHQGSDSEFPRNMMFIFQGTDQENFAKFDDLLYHDDGGRFTSYDYSQTENGAIFERNLPVYVDGEKYTLCIRFSVNYDLPRVQQIIRRCVMQFAVWITVIALLWCWQKNVQNKAKYTFEDYQRSLTDHLAHDIKTPLMAISGYAENIQKGSLSDAEQQQYLSAILENVSFTDTLISRTLFLNHIGEKHTGKQEEIQIAHLTEETIKKYELLLYEKQITYRISGSAALCADRTALETVIENLVSNAVKYTPENGSVGVTIDKKHLTITNTVTERVRTKELKCPFVRGDAARSNVKGNGLGLSIADRAAMTIGYTLSLSCTDTEFKAELKF